MTNPSRPPLPDEHPYNTDPSWLHRRESWEAVVLACNLAEQRRYGRNHGEAVHIVINDSMLIDSAFGHWARFLLDRDGIDNIFVHKV